MEMTPLCKLLPGATLALAVTMAGLAGSGARAATAPKNTDVIGVCERVGADFEVLEKWFEAERWSPQDMGRDALMSPPRSKADMEGRKRAGKISVMRYERKAWRAPKEQPQATIFLTRWHYSIGEESYISQSCEFRIDRETKSRATNSSDRYYNLIENAEFRTGWSVSSDGNQSPLVGSAERLSADTPGEPVSVRYQDFDTEIYFTSFRRSTGFISEYAANAIAEKRSGNSAMEKFYIAEGIKYSDGDTFALSGTIIRENAKNEQDFEESFRNFVKSAELGSRYGKRRLAESYMSGIGTQTNIGKGVDILESLAREGDGSAVWMLGTLYYSQGRSNDTLRVNPEAFARSISLDRWSALLGDPFGRYQFGSDLSKIASTEQEYCLGQFFVETALAGGVGAAERWLQLNRRNCSADAFKG